MTNLEIMFDSIKSDPNKLKLYNNKKVWYMYQSDSTLLMEAVNLNKIFNQSKIENLSVLIDEYLQTYPNEINKVDQRQQSALTYACQTPNPKLSDEKIIKVLIAAGANLNMIENAGMTALMIACCWENDDVIISLINNGTNINIINKYGQTAFDIYNQRRENYYLNPAFQLFIEKNADIKRTNDETAHYVNNLKKNKILEEENRILKKENELLKIELELIPGSSYVRSLGEHFYALTK